MLNNQKCNHRYEKQGERMVCTLCGRQYMDLKETKHDGLLIGKKTDGKSYSVRTSRSRYFFPDEWEKFVSKVNEKNKIIFEALLITGARITELMMLKKSHIVIDNGYLILYTTKVKSKKSETRPKQREVTLPKSFAINLKSYISGMNDNDYIFLNNSQLVNKDKKQIMSIAKRRGANVYQMFRRYMEASGIEDHWNFSLHNIRKTCGMWLKALNVKIEEVCFRLGHDFNTYLKHYGSADRFTRSDLMRIEKSLKVFTVFEFN